ncbi:16583_t:CDS:2 [Acaulospora colombiana]|uniref:16583_t:CDS:1 n=1 Tax=Acaulospora colombiana TaxID=27376 RepID=A0ACA9KIE8_9GLOM|nr:16583_t:CDS:2 [Acaulospora colombiana]
MLTNVFSVYNPNGLWYEYEVEDQSKNDGKVVKNGNAKSKVEKEANCYNNAEEVTNERNGSPKKNENEKPRKGKYDESAFRFEVHYDYEIFGYGWSIQPKTNDELFALAYLAKKFEVPGLTKFTDCLLRHITKSWKSNEYKWRVGLMVSKWLVLVETRLSILKFLARILVRIKDSEKVEMVKSIIGKEDSKEVERLMAEISDAGQNEHDHENFENELLGEDDILGLDKNGDVIEAVENIVCEQNSSDESSESSSSSSSHTSSPSPHGSSLFDDCHYECD